MIAKSISIKDTERKFGGRAWKSIELTSGGLTCCSGALPGLCDSRGSQTVRQKSAEGVVPVVQATGRWMWEGPNGMERQVDRLYR